MVTVQDLKNILMFQNLNDDFLNQLIPFIQHHEFKENQVIFKEGDKAEDFYMLKRGKILLEVEVSELIIISLGSIKNGYSFGWSALIPGAHYTSYAVCVEPSEVLSIKGEKFLEIINQDSYQASILLYDIFKILKNRLQRRTEQFLKVMSKHPDIQKLLGL